MVSRSRILVACILALAGVPALPSPAAASWMTPSGSNRAKDFTLVKHEGVFHVFYIRRDTTLPFDSTEVDFGHAKSRDLYVWEELPAVLAARPGSWDRDHVWAPSIVKRDGVYTMFYTGVTDRPAGPRMWQRTGIATSTDLEHWTRMDEPVASCLGVPWSVCDSMSAATAFRDPCVIPDPVQPGRWLMVYSAFASSDSTSMVAALAWSDGDFTSWQGDVPLWITHRSTTGNGLVESPNLVRHGGLTYLFFTTSYQQQLHYAVSPDPAGDPSLWSYRGSLGAMLGYDTGAWFASEHLADGLVDYFGFVNGDRVDIRKMTWLPNGTFQLDQPDVFHAVAMAWSADSARVGDPLVLSVDFANGFGRQLPFEVVAVAPDGSETPVAISSLGVAPPPPLWTAPVSWPWTMQALPDPLPDGTLPRLVVRTPDRTCVSAPLRLLPTSPAPPPGPGPRRLVTGPTSPPFVLVDFGAGGSVRVEIPAATPARVDLFDLHGRRLRTLMDRVVEAGVHRVPWDGRDEEGRLAPRGLYFARLAVPGRAPVTTRVVVR